MNPKLAILQRRLNISMPEKAPVPDTGLGAQIEALVTDAVQQQVADALERSPKVDRLIQGFNKPKPMPTDYRELPAVPKTAPAKNMSAQIMRDGAGLARWIQIGNLKFEALRDATGMLVGMRQVDESPVLPPPDIPFKAEAREYNPGESR